MYQINLHVPHTFISVYMNILISIRRQKKIRMFIFCMQLFFKLLPMHNAFFFWTMHNASFFYWFCIYDYFLVYIFFSKKKIWLLWLAYDDKKKFVNSNVCSFVCSCFSNYYLCIMHLSFIERIKSSLPSVDHTFIATW